MCGIVSTAVCMLGEYATIINIFRKTFDYLYLFKILLKFDDPRLLLVYYFFICLINC